MTRAKPWRQSGTVSSTALSRSSFEVLKVLLHFYLHFFFFCNFCISIFLWSLDSLHFFEAVGSAIDQLDDKPKLAMPSAPEEVEPADLPRLSVRFSSNRKWKNYGKRCEKWMEKMPCSNTESTWMVWISDFGGKIWRACDSGPDLSHSTSLVLLS